MTETEIFTSLNNTLMATGLFAITWAFLVWVAGRAVTIAVENNAGIITKIVTTIFGLSALWQFNFAFAYVPWSFATAAHSLAVLKSSERKSGPSNHQCPNSSASNGATNNTFLCIDDSILFTCNSLSFR